MGEWLTAVAGVALVVTLFLPWFTHPATGDLTAWEAFTVLDVVLLKLGLLAIGLLVLTAVQPTAAVGIAADALLTLLAGGVVLVTAVRLLGPPEVAGVELERAGWGWVGLAAACGVLVGAVLAMRDERLSRPGELTDATGAPMVAPPEVEAFPVPRREQGGEPS